jgi:hypothetical protein
VALPASRAAAFRRGLHVGNSFAKRIRLAATAYHRNCQSTRRRPRNLGFRRPAEPLIHPKNLFHQLPFSLADGKPRIFPLGRQQPALAQHCFFRIFRDVRHDAQRSQFLNKFFGLIALVRRQRPEFFASQKKPSLERLAAWLYDLLWRFWREANGAFSCRSFLSVFWSIS